MRSTTLALLLVCPLLAAACGGGSGDDITPMPDAGDEVPIGFQGPDDYCPGSAHCTGAGGDGKLYAGAGAAAFTPTIVETWTDTDGNGEFDSDDEYVDVDGDGDFDAFWLFGGRPATGAFDDVEARAIAFRQHDTTVVICYLDLLGFLADDMQAIRDDARLAGLEIDHIVLGSTHDHDAPDTVGINNANPLRSGINPDFTALVHDAAVTAIRDAVMKMKPARMRIAQTLILDDPADLQSGTNQFNKDIRDPVIYDPTLTIAHFTEESDPTKTLAVLVNWASHPETAAYVDGNFEIAADFPHFLRAALEAGLPAEGIVGLGGTAVFAQGPLGGQIGPLHGVAPLDPAGVPITTHGHAKAQAIGENLAKRALAALETDGQDFTDAAVSYKTAEVFARVDNIGFQTYFLLDIIAPHRLVGYDPTRPVEGANVPWIPLRITYVQVGPLAVVTAPGELHPELWVGGYDGSWSWGYPILDPLVTENVPILSSAPQAPYMRDLALAHTGVQYTFLAGCAEDYVGYIVPAYNYVLHASNPYLEEAEGQHYEETRSLSPDEEDQLIVPILDLLKWRPGT